MDTKTPNFLPEAYEMKIKARLIICGDPAVLPLAALDAGDQAIHALALSTSAGLTLNKITYLRPE